MSSFEDFLEEDFVQVLLVIAFICFAFALTMLFTAIVKKSSRNHQENMSNIRTLYNITVIDKQESRMTDFLMNNRIIVEDLRGKRLELRIDNTNLFATTMIGDTGDVTYQLNKLIRFNRKPIDVTNERSSPVDRFVSKDNFNTEPAQTNEFINCPKCNTPQHSYRKTCYHCGFEFAKPEAVNPAPVNNESLNVEVTDNNTIICPDCGTEQNSNRSLCYKCGKKFVVIDRSNVPYWCGKCGHNGPYENYCPKCGSTIKKFSHQ